MVRDELRALTPRLRRYARALVAGSPSPCETADSLVHATLMRAIGSRGVGGTAGLPVRLFATLTQLHRDLATSARPDRAIGGGAWSGGPATAREPAPTRDPGLAAALLDLNVEEREALLLVVLEGFDHATAARILRVARPVLFDRLTRARSALGKPRQLPMAAPPAAAKRVRAPHLRLVVG